MTPKSKCLKTVYGTPIVPMGVPQTGKNGAVWVTAYPDEDKSRQFSMPVGINDVEGGLHAVNEFLGIPNGTKHEPDRLAEAPAPSGTDSP